MKTTIRSLVICLSLIICVPGCKQSQQVKTSIQLNWFHDPSFIGEYLLYNSSVPELSIREGGPNIFPIAEVLAGRADLAIVGADIFLQALDNDFGSGKESNLRCIFIDFQRNPVGWVLHPDAAAKAGLDHPETIGPIDLNKWLFDKFAAGTIQPGDKRGTETTAVWIKWKQVFGLPETVKVVPVGFDSSFVLSAPMVAYPVYLNEEPYKLSEIIGRSLVVFDPAIDGVTLYGNVLITSKAFSENNPLIVDSIQKGLQKVLGEANKRPDSAISVVSEFYKGVGLDVLKKQVDKTLEFIFYGTNMPGIMDIDETGKWAQTIEALKSAGILSPSFGLKTCLKYFIPPK